MPEIAMDTEELKKHALKLTQKAHNMRVKKAGDTAILGIYSQAMEFLRVYGGPRNSFLKTLGNLDFDDYVADDILLIINSIMSSFLENLEEGLHAGVSSERAAQLDVVSDYLDMANNLLLDKKVHPAAPAVIIGATLEEFLRTWVESEALPVSGAKPGLDAYAKALRGNELITKQDKKNIDSWAGLRNHAAHGEWDEVKNKELVNLMLQGVNLFIATYSKE